MGRLPRGDLERTYVGRNTAQIEGSDAATGDYLYHTHDHLGSTRAVYDQGRNRVAAFEYTPYGRALFSTNRALTTRGYTGHAREAHLGGAYYAPFRYYHPSLARWEKRDPLGMIDGPNVYAYVGGNQINRVDPLGLQALDCSEKLGLCLTAAGVVCTRIPNPPAATACLAVLSAACWVQYRCCSRPHLCKRPDFSVRGRQRHCDKVCRGTRGEERLECLRRCRDDFDCRRGR